LATSPKEFKSALVPLVPPARSLMEQLTSPKKTSMYSVKEDAKSSTLDPEEISAVVVAAVAAKAKQNGWRRNQGARTDAVKKTVLLAKGRRLISGATSAASAAVAAGAAGAVSAMSTTVAAGATGTTGAISAVGAAGAAGATGAVHKICAINAMSAMSNTGAVGTTGAAVAMGAMNAVAGVTTSPTPKVTSDADCPSWRATSII
jgi:hypothetical protein